MGAGASSKASDDDANWMKEMNDLITIDQLGEEIEVSRFCASNLYFFGVCVFVCVRVYVVACF